jgi:hypothetical protein
MHDDRGPNKNLENNPMQRRGILIPLTLAVLRNRDSPSPSLRRNPSIGGKKAWMASLRSP